MNSRYLAELGLRTIEELETEKGILASSREEIFGCVFGRDSLITALKLLRVYRREPHPRFLNIARKSLFTLADLQGREANIESGEEPGKIIHEWRPDNHEHLTQGRERPWYVYPDGEMKSYDSVDSTPLFLITLYRYLQIVPADKEILRTAAVAALHWLLEYSDKNGDGFIDYGLPEVRKYGGLVAQNWMDSEDSVFHEDGYPVSYPLAPVEAQAYSYLAMRLWSRSTELPVELREQISSRADILKTNFNKNFVLQDKQGTYLAAGLDDRGLPLRAVRSSMGHVLWASLVPDLDGELDGILNNKHIPEVVGRIMTELLDLRSGIRTLSPASRRFAPVSYHNGSVWPHDNAIIAEGFINYGYTTEADIVKEAVKNAISVFATPVELYVAGSDGPVEYVAPSGQRACRKQAWSAAALLDFAVSETKTPEPVVVPEPAL